MRGTYSKRMQKLANEMQANAEEIGKPPFDIEDNTDDAEPPKPINLQNLERRASQNDRPSLVEKSREALSIQDEGAYASQDFRNDPRRLSASSKTKSVDRRMKLPDIEKAESLLLRGEISAKSIKQSDLS